MILTKILLAPPGHPLVNPFTVPGAPRVSLWKVKQFLGLSPTGRRHINRPATTSVGRKGEPLPIGRDSAHAIISPRAIRDIGGRPTSLAYYKNFPVSTLMRHVGNESRSGIGWGNTAAVNQFMRGLAIAVALGSPGPHPIHAA